MKHAAGGKVRVLVVLCSYSITFPLQYFLAASHCIKPLYNSIAHTYWVGARFREGLIECRYLCDPQCLLQTPRLLTNSGRGDTHSPFLCAFWCCLYPTATAAFQNGGRRGRMNFSKFAGHPIVYFSLKWKSWTNRKLQFVVCGNDIKKLSLFTLRGNSQPPLLSDSTASSGWSLSSCEDVFPPSLRISSANTFTFSWFH